MILCIINLYYTSFRKYGDINYFKRNASEFETCLLPMLYHMLTYIIKQCVQHNYKTILCNNKREQNINTFYSMDEPQKHYAK